MAERVTRPLWPAALALWPLVTSLTAPLLPAGPGHLSERPWAWALVAGGCCAIPVWVFDFVRDRRVWLAALIGWGTLSCLSVADVALSSTDGDMDQQIGWAIATPGLVALPVIGVSLFVKAISASAAAWNTRRRRWRVEVKRSKVVLARRKGG